METEVTDANLFAEAISPAHRANPYPLYARLRETPVALQENGAYVVSTYQEIRSLLLDPRLSSQDLPEPRHPKTGNLIKDWILNPMKARIIARHRPLIFRDPPDHDRLRLQVMHQFTRERIEAMRGRIHATVDELIDRMEGRAMIDLVGDFSYPLPVAMICELLGVPAEDEAKFEGWSKTLARGLDPDLRLDEAQLLKNLEAYQAITDYLGVVVKAKRKRPKDDLLSGLATQRAGAAGRMGKYDLIATAVLLLVAGHETTVNLIANGMLTLLRHPKHLERLRKEPKLAPRLIDELLRYEPPVHFRTRKALADIDIGGVRIPKGAPLMLLFAAGNRDPKRFVDPDLFDPERADNQHFGFGGGLHYCLGAPLARIEAEAALVALAGRLVDPRLAADPPPYRPGASLRGPQRLEVTLEGVVPRLSRAAAGAGGRLAC